MSKKFIIGVAILAAILLCTAIILLVTNKDDGTTATVVNTESQTINNEDTSLTDQEESLKVEQEQEKEEAPVTEGSTSTTNNEQEQNTTDKKPTVQEKVVVKETVIKSEENPDVSEYTEELTAYVNKTLIGNWKGTTDDFENENTIYWTYSFTTDGKYTFSDGNTTETGTYKVTSDPNNNDYHSSLTLTYGEDQTKTVQFNFMTTNPVKMNTDIESSPTFIKQ